MIVQVMTCAECRMWAEARGDRELLEMWADRCRAAGHHVELTVGPEDAVA